MNPKEIYESIRNLKVGSLNNSISSEDDYSKITLLVSLLKNKNIQYSKIYLGDKLLGTYNKYRHKKDDIPQEDLYENEDIDNEVTSLFSSMITSYLNTVKINPNLLKTIIIFLIHNNKVAEFRNINKLVNSEWGIKAIEYLDNLSINSILIKSSFLPKFDNYPIHKKILTERIQELIVTNNCRERYLVLMKPAWESGELSPDDSQESEFINDLLNLRKQVRDINLNIKVEDLCDLLELPYGTYGNKKREFIKSISSYFNKSVYSNLIDLLISMN